MKKHLSKKSLWQLLLSVMALGIFILLALGSILYEQFRIIAPYETVHLGKGIYRSTWEYSHGNIKKTRTGKRDIYGHWHGAIKDEYVDTDDEEIWKINNYTLENGKRHGQSIWMTSDGRIWDEYYNKGVKIENPDKSANISTADISAFQVLVNKYPWFLYSLTALTYNNEFIEAYMDTLEEVLCTYEFEVIDFNDYYKEVIDDLEWTVYDSIIDLNSDLTILQGLEELKNAELRLAVIDHDKSDGKSTYDIINVTYPGYLLSLNDAGVNDQDFEGFCQDLDSCLTSYGSLDPEDPFFIDSVDVRMFRALEYIHETGESALKSMSSLKSAVRFSMRKDIRDLNRDANSILRDLILKSNPSDVVEVVATLMLSQFDQGDIIKRSVREAYLIEKGVVRLPLVTTEFSSHNSATSVTLNGYVHEDGGADITARGMAWATFYNPTTNDNTKPSGTGTGNFAVNLDGLTEGTTYYARTYATNSAGTAYGNCIYFTAGSSVSISEINQFAREFNVYPNPASGITTFNFQVESSESIVLTIVDLKGQLVYQYDLGTLPPGENQVQQDLSGLQEGIYICQLTGNGTTKRTRKLLIAR